MAFMPDKIRQDSDFRANYAFPQQLTLMADNGCACLETSLLRCGGCSEDQCAAYVTISYCLAWFTNTWIRWQAMRLLTLEPRC